MASSTKNQQRIEKALRSQDSATIDAVLKLLPNINATVGGSSSRTCLEFAAVYGLVDSIKHLLRRGADPNSQEPAFVASREGNAEILELLLDAGAQIEARSSTGDTLLLEAAVRNTPQHLACIRLLIARGADVNVVQSNQVQNVLMSCAELGSIPMVEALVAAGARLNDVWLRGTALTIAAEQNQRLMVEWLLRHGADPSLRVPAETMFDDIAGMTALEVARKNRLKKIVAILESAPSAASVTKPAATSTKKEKKSKPRSKPLGSVQETLSRLTQALKDQGQWKAAGLRKPALESQLAELERKVGLALPRELREAYLTFNGQKSGGYEIFPAPDPDEERFFWLSVAEVASEWQVFQDVSEADGNPPRSADPGVRESWWHKGWLPFVSNGGGDVICIDMAPAKGGSKGQVIIVSHESAPRRRLANSFLEFLDATVESIESHDTVE
ncbi:MAG: ankyrin repeat domain-containing protein [Planctomycetaceae bacterium]|nr:ankyrin repeat domain-containing protein [Planctomycetaceae bacterium]